MKVVVVGTNQKDRERVAKVIKDKYGGLAEMNEGLRDNKRYLENDLALKMEQIAALTTERDGLRVELEKLDSPYCPTCGACGEEGCCPPDRCKHLVCFYGAQYAKTYRELEVENKRLREALRLYLLPDEIEALRGEVIEDGFGSSWSAYCAMCGKKTMQIVRPGKVQCAKCG